MLEGSLQQAARAVGDRSIAHRLHCDCADCKELARFLASKRTDHDWPLAQERRQHIHGIIDSEKLPVRHTTLRQGRPYLLQLRKEESLFGREEANRRQLNAILRELPRLPR